jgi:hypothetical protein
MLIRIQGFDDIRVFKNYLLISYHIKNLRERLSLFFLFKGGGSGGCILIGSPPGKEAELRQVGVQAVDVHVEDVQVGVTAVVDEVAQVPVIRRVHLHENREVISIGHCSRIYRSCTVVKTSFKVGLQRG